MAKYGNSRRCADILVVPRKQQLDCGVAMTRNSYRSECLFEVPKQVIVTRIGQHTQLFTIGH
jgi:hypothetical protein